MGQKKHLEVITVDGYVAAGKGTIATGVAQRLGRQYLDTGAMFRALSLSLLQDAIDTSDADAVAAYLPSVEIGFVHNAETNHDDVTLGGVNVEDEIRTPRVSAHIGTFVGQVRVRAWLCEQRRAIGRAGQIVVDGRDMGTVVFPDAPLKVFVIADAQVRAQRRYAQLQSQGRDGTLEEIRADIAQRDQHDYLGLDAVNTRADDARVLDTTSLTIDEQIDRVIGWAREAKII